MATTNVTLSSSWQKLVDSGQDFTISFVHSGRAQIVEIAIVGTDTAPTVAHGRQLAVGVEQNPGINRSITGPGYVFGRLASGNGSLIAVLDAWTP